MGEKRMNAHFSAPNKFLFYRQYSTYVHMVDVLYTNCMQNIEQSSTWEVLSSKPRCVKHTMKGRLAIKSGQTVSSIYRNNQADLSD